MRLIVELDEVRHSVDVIIEEDENEYLLLDTLLLADIMLVDDVNILVEIIQSIALQIIES